MKKWYLFMAFVFVSLNAVMLASSAATGEEWNLTYKGMGVIKDIHETQDQGYIFASNSPSGPLQTILLVKTDQNGNELWSKTYGGIGTNLIAYSVRQTMDAGYIVGGNMWKYEAAAGNIINVWIMKTDRDGNTLWQKTYDEKEYESARYVRRSKDGGYLILADRGGAGFWFIKTDENGSVEWHDRFEGNNPSSVIETSDSGYIIGGVKDDSCGNHGSDFWLIKLVGSRMADGYPDVVKEMPGGEGQPDVTKTQGFEWILMISVIMVAFAARKR